MKKITYKGILENREIIKHYGVLGMRWGRRTKNTSRSPSTSRVRRATSSVKTKLMTPSKGYVNNYVKNAYNSVRHPIYQKKAHYASSAHSMVGTNLMIGPIKTPTKTSLYYKNDVVRKLVSAKRKMNPTKRFSATYRLSSSYRYGESKRVQNVINNTPYRKEGISRMKGNGV